ncbi:putative flavin dependent monooxygenase [Leptodontidium sp. 2 PMI_412]|nr:putative flavin dependent monooxygenase [Leptodontidium sp. 2 PMI_412]
MDSNSETSFDVKSVAIIGGGPSGIATAKYLAAENHFSDISIFEQRNSVGGIWNRDSISPALDVEAFPSPIYDGLESNIPTVVMQHSDLPFPDDCALMADADAVLKYLRLYANDVSQYTNFHTQVLDVRSEVVDSKSQWQVKLIHLESGQEESRAFDAVVVANERAEKFEKKKVVLVGFSSSGVDIALKIESVCSSPLIISQKSAAGLSPGSLGFAEGKIMVPEIISINAATRTVLFVNGREEGNVDNIIFCTGYDYDYPFLKSIPGFEQGNKQGKAQTFQHVFYLQNPTLAFVLLPLRAVAFPFAESQVAVIARIWAGRMTLPPLAAMKDWVQNNKAMRGTGKAFHKLSYPADADYMNEMRAWCDHASGEDGVGKKPPYWGEKERWLRQKIHAIKRATEEKGEDRILIRHVEDVGFEFPGKQ